MTVRVTTLFAATLVLAGCPSPAPEEAAHAELARYQSDTHGFSIQYPDTLDIRVYSPEHLDIGRMIADEFESEAQVGLYFSLPGEPRPASFADFAHDRARMLCAADGPRLSLECTAVERASRFETEDGPRGEVFYLRHETLDVSTGEVVEVSGRGPFFALDLSLQVPDTEFAVLLVHPPVVRDPAEVDAGLVRRIARSARLAAVTAAPELVEQMALVHDVLLNDEAALVFDRVDWIEDPDAPAGFRVENPQVLLDTLELAADAIIRVLDSASPDRRAAEERLSVSAFADRFSPEVPYRLTLHGPRVVAVTEQYVP